VTTSDEEFELSVGAVAASDAAAVSALFERCEVSCHCRYWHFTGDKNAWLERCAFSPQENAREFAESLRESSELQGVVARKRDGSEVVGWMKLTPVARVEKLYAQRLYKGLPCFGGNREGVYAIGCFLVDPSVRRRGVSHRLLSAGIELARQAGAVAIEAFPRRAELLADEELWTGPFSAFTRAGFAIAHDFAPYPVLRLAL
jgi:GNAT superfamily N-acetyltransferase